RPGGRQGAGRSQPAAAKPARSAGVARTGGPVLPRDRPDRGVADRHRDVAAGTRAGALRGGMARANPASGEATVNGPAAKPCPEWALMLHGFVDGELDAAHSLEIERHIATCPHCARELESLQALKQRIA